MPRAIPLLAALAACQPIPSSSTWPPTAPPVANAVGLAPSDVGDDDGTPVPAPTPGGASDPGDAFSGGAEPAEAPRDDDGPDDGAPDAAPDDDAPAPPPSATQEALQARALGVDPATVTSGSPDAAPAPVPPPSVDVSAWGVRLVSTLSETQPPRAVLALGDGSEIVVQPGTMLPEARLVVLAIGRDAVQVAHVQPDGDRARIEPRMLTPLYARPEAPAPP